MRPPVLPPEAVWAGNPDTTGYPDVRLDMEYWVPYRWPEYIKCSYFYTGKCAGDDESIVTKQEHVLRPDGQLNTRCRAHQNRWAQEGE